jgi:Uma2 family endonuclease
MPAVPKLDRLSVEDYLAGELVSPVKHEYLAGVVYAMAGARNMHNDIAVNLVSNFYTRLRGTACRPKNSDTKVRVRLSPTDIRFYYPDAFVVCRPNAPEDAFHDEPVLVAEVLSQSTRRIDEGEKKDAYLAIPSLSVYLLVEQSSPVVVVHRRTENGFVSETYQGLDAIIPLPELGTALPLSEVYDGVSFVPEQFDDVGKA